MRSDSTTAMDSAGATARPARTAALTATSSLVLPADLSLPLLASQSGNLFRDSLDATRRWYLPSFVLADDVDPAFAFAAAKSVEVDSAGNPYATATLAIGLREVKPADVVAWQNHAPSSPLQPIPLENLGAMLMLDSHDAATGAPRAVVVSGTFTTGSQGCAQFHAILGANAIIA
jgi:hypothetical protein